jgi:hypothetical protein
LNLEPTTLTLGGAQFKVKMQTADDDMTTDIICEGDIEEIERMRKELQLLEKGKVGAGWGGGLHAWAAVGVGWVARGGVGGVAGCVGRARKRGGGSVLRSALTMAVPPCWPQVYVKGILDA